MLESITNDKNDIQINKNSIITSDYEDDFVEEDKSDNSCPDQIEDQPNQMNILNNNSKSNPKNNKTKCITISPNEKSFHTPKHN